MKILLVMFQTFGWMTAILVAMLVLAIIICPIYLIGMIATFGRGKKVEVSKVEVPK